MPTNNYYVRLVDSADEMGLSFSDVVIVLAADEHFAPYMAVALESIVENTAPSRHYDIVILTRNMTQHSIDALVGHTQAPNVSLGFLNAEVALRGVRLPHHGHFRPETYFRLLAPWLLPACNKAVYLDSDLVVLDDIATLFDTNLEGHLIGATRDADTLGQIGGYDETVGPYLADELNLKDPSQYFQAGVLVMNLDTFRHVFTIDDMLTLSTKKMWRWLDQDVLNMLANGEYVRIDMRWNTLVDWKGIRCKSIIPHAPAEVREQYELARTNPAVVHYAGPDDRPWDYPDCDMAEYFWDYAERSTFIDELKGRLYASQNTMSGRLNRAKVGLVLGVALPAFDAVFKPGTKARTFWIKSYVAVGGDIT